MVGTRSRPKVVVLGLMTKSPVAGVVWQTMHYLLGLERLGCDPYYVEAHARSPAMFVREGDDGSQRAAGFLAGVMARFELHDRWAFHALHSDGRCYGMPAGDLGRLYRDADLILNLSGGTAPLPEHSATGRLVFLETDPVRLQIELSEGRQEAIDFLEPHCALYTFGENYGTRECPLPVSDRFSFRPTRQPVVIDLWSMHGVPAEGAFRTVGSWRQGRRDVVIDGERYFWSKHHEFLKFIHLPQRAGGPFELALNRCDDSDRELLESHGWSVRSADEVSHDPDVYRHYVCGSRAEFTVAKDQNVRLRTGWFSDRSATYLAAGRPVVTQDTGFGTVLPTGAGLFAFSSVEDVLSAREEIEADYVGQSHAAAEIAREYFGHDVVLGRILDDLGVARPAPSTARRPTSVPFPDDLVLSPTSRRPLRLPDDSVERVLSRPLPRTARPSGVRRPQVSIIVVAFNHLVFSRLCLESLLAHTDDSRYEVVVIDNASSDGTASYLLELARRRPEVRVHFNDRNRGFAAANNRGLAEARGEILVLLNNDTIVTPGWLPGLARHLDDGDVGLVGPVTNRTCNEAQIDASYDTYGELLAFATDRSAGRAPFDIRMLAMFCVAMRREVFERVGPLDERFGLGTLEDEDYAIRVRQAGYRVACAEDVFVHHFGHASFDELVPSGTYHRLLAENTRILEEKWGVRWQPYARRLTEDYARLTGRIRDVISRSLPDGASVAVVSKGDDELLPNDGRAAWHFPSTNGGRYAGGHPAGDAEAIQQLEAVRAEGAAFFVIPSTSLWWLDHYEGFRDHLQERYAEVIDDRESCVVYALDPPGSAVGRSR